jgi:hypothetical protein
MCVDFHLQVVTIISNLYENGKNCTVFHTVLQCQST